MAFAVRAWPPGSETFGYMDKRDPVGRVCQHFWKTFGKVPWNGLLKKLTCQGLRGKVHAPEK